ncbi:MAG: InlB B-repeat-containing protein [Clostridiales bacterium]|nr:InlB B-repeat-containing protein [Clostridiales bacterium]
MEGTFSIHYDVDFDIHIWGTELFLRDNSFEVALKDVTLELTDDSVLDGVTIPIVTFSEEVVYVLSVSGGVNVYVSGGGKGKTVFDTNIREGYGCTVTLYGDVVPVFDDWSWNHDANFDITSSNQRGEVYVAYGYGADVKFIEILGVGASYKTGVVVGGETSKNHEYPGYTEKKFWHECEDDECVSGSAFWRFGPLSLECIIGPYSAPIAEIAKKDFDPFKEYYSSDTFHDQSMTSPCPHKGYRLNVEVVSDTGEKIPGASVFYSPYTEHYAGAMNKETDSEGKAVLYAPKIPIDVTAVAYSNVDPDIVANRTVSIEKTEDVQDLQVVLEIPVKHLRFMNSASGKTKGWPNNIDFKPFFSKDVQIPDEVPELSGRVFTGWNTAEDGSGTSYMPGTKLSLKDDLTLWAQWQIAGDSWYVVYNANGGTKAPDPQIVRKNQDAVLTAELPEYGDLTFNGWTQDPQNPDPVYQPGDTLRYDSGKKYVVLYAIWNLSPADRPAIITFRANGGLPDTVPGPVSRPKSVWFLLPESEPVWDAQHLFLGWSDNPEAVEARWKAGAAAVFNQDTTLYAVWKARYSVIEGSGSVWTKGSGKTQRFVADGNIMYFTELRIDGKRFDNGVRITSGSTVADISPEAMEKLSVGMHKVEFVYEDGEASAPFIIRKKLPPTGDQSDPLLWLLLIGLGTAGIAVAGIRARAEKKKR